MSGPRRIVCISDSDTRMKWTLRVGRSIQKALGTGLETELVVVSVAEGAVPSERQLDENRISENHRVCGDDTLSTQFSSRTSIVVALTVGTRFHRIAEAIRELGEDRPLLITGYAGVVYEKHVIGALWRSAADFAFCNSAKDEALFRDLYRDLGLNPSIWTRAGIGVASSRAPDPETLARNVRDYGPIRTLTFAVQPDVPKDANMRSYLLKQLIRYAQVHPDRRVVIKLRAAPDEKTTHTERFHYEELLGALSEGQPPNLSFEYGLMSDVLSATDLLVTLSSTAALESLSYSIPTALLTDLGIGEDLGNHFFVGSGLFASMDDLIADRIPSPDPKWLAQNGFDAEDRLGCATSRVASTILDIEAGTASMPMLPTGFYSDSRATYIHERAISGTAARSRTKRAAARSRTKRAAAWLLDTALIPARKMLRPVQRWARS